MRVVTVFMGSDCGNGPIAAARVRAVASDLGLDVRVDEVVIATQAEAEREGIPGSPTVRVAGQDIDPQARALRSYAMT
jgi:hypothetical protein